MIYLKQSGKIPVIGSIWEKPGEHFNHMVTDVELLPDGTLKVDLQPPISFLGIFSYYGEVDASMNSEIINFLAVVYKGKRYSKAKLYPQKSMIRFVEMKKKSSDSIHASTEWMSDLLTGSIEDDDLDVITQYSEEQSAITIFLNCCEKSDQ